MLHIAENSTVRDPSHGLEGSDKGGPLSGSHLNHGSEGDVKRGARLDVKGPPGPGMLFLNPTPASP
jgi:hypothetical protein